MTEYANRKRLPAPAFRVRDMVILNSRNIRTTRPSKSLDHKNLGPFKIIRAINNIAYELELSEGIDIYPIFHPWLLHADNSDPLPEQSEESSPPIHTNEKSSEHQVDKVIDFRINHRRIDPYTEKKGCLMYKFKWISYDDPTKWQPYWNAAGYPDLVTDFHHVYPDKTGPHPSFKTPED